MKDKILMLIIGILIGAVITAGGFLLFGKNGNKPEKRNFDTDMIDEERRGRQRDGNNIGEPPAKPEGDNEEIDPSGTTENT